MKINARKKKPTDVFHQQHHELLKRTVANCSKCGVGGKSLFSEWCARKRTVAFFFWQLFPAKIDLHFSDEPMFLDRRNQTPKERKRKENWHFVTDLLQERKEREEGEFICQDEEGPLYASVNDIGVWEIGVKKSVQLHLRIAYKSICGISVLPKLPLSHHQNLPLSTFVRCLSCSVPEEGQLSAPRTVYPHYPHFSGVNSLLLPRHAAIREPTMSNYLGWRLRKCHLLQA